MSESTQIKEPKKECCLEWTKSIAELNRLSEFCYIHNAGYKGKPFLFCPWCGKPRNEEIV